LCQRETLKNLVGCNKTITGTVLNFRKGESLKMSRIGRSGEAHLSPGVGRGRGKPVQKRGNIQSIKGGSTNIISIRQIQAAWL